MNDQQMQSLLDAWFEDTDPAPPDTRRTAVEIMARVPQTRQRGRWLPFPLFRRKVQTPTATDTTDYQPSPILATNGHAPTVIGRTQTMFSPAKAITAGALVFAIGGAFLIAQPFDQQAETAPAAEVGDYAEPVKFTLVLTPGAPTVSPTCEVIRGMTACKGMVSPVAVSEVSDPRLAGSMTAVADQYQWPLQPWWETLTLRISNDDGAWQGSFIGTREGSQFGRASVVLEGEEAYEGLYAWMDMSDFPSVANGVIFAAPPPDAPVIPPSAGS
jgi:hypothetical protein